jgi:hypothetical protein
VFRTASKTCDFFNAQTRNLTCTTSYFLCCSRGKGLRISCSENPIMHFSSYFSSTALLGNCAPEMSKLWYSLHSPLDGGAFSRPFATSRSHVPPVQSLGSHHCFPHAGSFALRGHVTYPVPVATSATVSTSSVGIEG